jgi:gluconate 2-dehydrogenase subunit 3-like protein
MSKQPSKPTYRLPSEVDTSLLPRDARTGDALSPSEQPGYYPGYSTLSQQAYWDKTTRDLVNDRVNKVPRIRHFSADSACFWRAVFDHILPQTDRVPERQIPILERLDERLYNNRGIGYRYEKMPSDREAYQLAEIAINQESEARCSANFINLPHLQQEIILQAIHDGKPASAQDIWKRMPITRFWLLLLQDAIEAYYSHPWAWDEIGFGGPAYPRAYTRLERGEPEPWEVEEERHEWNAPRYSVSDTTESTHHLHSESRQNELMPDESQ